MYMIQFIESRLYITITNNIDEREVKCAMKYNYFKSMVIFVVMLFLLVGCSNRTKDLDIKILSKYDKDDDWENDDWEDDKGFEEYEDEYEEERYKTREEKEKVVSNAIADSICSVYISVSNLTDEQLDAFIFILDDDISIITDYGDNKYHFVGPSRREIREEIMEQGFNEEVASYVVDNLNVDWEQTVANKLRFELNTNVSILSILPDLEEVDEFTRSEIGFAIIDTKDIWEKEVELVAAKIGEEATWELYSPVFSKYKIQ